MSGRELEKYWIVVIRSTKEFASCPGKSQQSKEAWLASHNFGIDHDGPWGRLDGLTVSAQQLPTPDGAPRAQIRDRRSDG